MPPSTALDAALASEIAVTGAGGRLGRLLRAAWAGPDVAWHARAQGALGPMLAGRRALISLAGVTRGDRAALAGNTEAALAALEAAREAGLARVILMSSAAIYGRAQGPLVEEDDPVPAAPYGEAKAAMERAVDDWSAAHPGGPEAVCLRLGNVAGADALLGALTDAVPVLDTFADGTTPRRSYVGPVTLAGILAALVAHPAHPPSILNVAAPEPVEMADLLRAAGCDWSPRPAPADAIASVALDTARLAALVVLPPDASDPARMVAEWRRLVA